MCTVIHTTQVTLSKEALQSEIWEARHTAASLAGHGSGDELKSARSVYSSLLSYYETHFDVFSSNSEVVSVQVKGVISPDSCARVYYRPSFTSAPRALRKAIVPCRPSHQFLYFDIQAAEFFLTCLFADEKQVIQAYCAGVDIYDALAYLFPKGTLRKHYKMALLAYIYGASAFTLSGLLQVSVSEAFSIAKSLKQGLPRLTQFQERVINLTCKLGYYIYPIDFQQCCFKSISFKAPSGSTVPQHNPNLALSVYTQSALGYFMQGLLKETAKLTEGTLLSVFDSLLIEHLPSQVEALKDFFTQRLAPFRLAPFRLAPFGTGQTFFDACT